jgi:ABC-type lipoprotein release transport system permease subunit
VARRTREIGVRVALGASHGRIASAILARTTRLVTIGVLMGLPLPVWMFMEGNLEPGVVAGLVGFYCAGMIPICMGACVVPLRRALSIQPTDALAAES